MSNRIQQLAVGATAWPALSTIQINNVVQDMSAPGWTCSAGLVDEDSTPVTTPRAITELVTSDGVQKFRVTMLRSESREVSVPAGEVKKFLWVIQTVNDIIEFEDETPIPLLFRSNAIP